MKNIFSFLSIILISIVSLHGYGQNARLQILHNAPDTSIMNLDVYIDGNLEKSNLFFRSATNYIEISPGTNINIGIAMHNSNSANDTLMNFTADFLPGENYIAIISGIYNEQAYSAIDPLDIYLFSGSKEFADSNMYNDLLFFNGSPDAPAIDATETHRPMGQIIDNLQRNQFSGYHNVESLDYVLSFSDYLQNNSIENIKAPLYSFCLFSYALTIVTSGFLDPVQNNNGPEFGVFLVWPQGGTFWELDKAEQTNIQFIHNSADLSLDVVDIYRNDEKLIDNFEFRTATPFLSLTADIYHDISIAPENSSSVNDALKTISIYPYSNYNTIATLSGIHSPTGYTLTDELYMITRYNGRIESANPGNTDIIFFQGSTDAPHLDIVENERGNGTLVNGAWLYSYNGYIELPTQDYIFNVMSDDQNTNYGKHHAMLSGYNLEDKAITILSSGFMDPSMNSFGPEFGLFWTTASGGNLIPFPSITTGIADYKTDIFKMYPNPANEFTTISINRDTGEEINIQLLDINGKLVKDFGTHKSNAGEIKLNISDIPEGNYSVLSKTKSFTSTKKLLIIR